MAYFAKIDNNIVTQVIVVANEDCLDSDGNESEAVGIQFCVNLFGGTWKQTSYNENIRKNYAGIGDEYDSTRDAFIPEQPYLSWTLNETTCKWEAPVAYPDNGELHLWNEATTSWEEKT